MKIKYNGCELETQAKTVEQFKELHDPEADIVIVNAFAAQGDQLLKSEDEVVLIKRGRQPSEEVLEHLMVSRHTPKVHEKMKKAKVGIAGVGGLGSNACIALARMGVGKLILCDFDLVEPSNLNRQAYFVEHLGRYKVDAMKDLIDRINPYLQVEVHKLRIDATNASAIFSDCDVVIEAFDDPESKAVLVTSLLEECTMPIIAGSGMAAALSSNTIQTIKKFNRLYLVGDLEAAAGQHMGLMAPRVLVASAHQANMAVRLILGDSQP